MRLSLLLLLVVVGLASSAPQWPYRDVDSYYGYQSGGNNQGQYYRSSSGGSEDDEEESISSLARQDLKVSQGANSAVNAAGGELTTLFLVFHGNFNKK
jgi:hypothetical protein